MTEAEEYHIGKIEKIIKQQIPREALPANLEILQTPFVEKQIMLREIDEQRKKEDPDFKGAFHEKKDFKVKAKQKEISQKKQIIAGGKEARKGSFGKSSSGGERKNRAVKKGGNSRTGRK
jgi:ATP-dependent RNA helicase RhlE